MTREKPIKRVWIAAVAALLAWPVGSLVGFILSTGQDGPGAALASAVGNLVTLIVWIVALLFVAMNRRKGLAQLGKGARVGVLAAIAFLPAALTWQSANRQAYDVRVWNETGAEITEVSVRFSGRHYSFSVFGVDKAATSSFQYARPKGVAIVMWTDAGTSHEVEIDLGEIVPRRYDNGVLTFTIKPAGNATAGFFIQPDLSF